jgi:hypothetical protein
MEFVRIDENLEDGDRSVPDLGFKESFWLMMAFCEHCKRSSRNSRFKLQTSLPIKLSRNKSFFDWKSSKIVAASVA